MGGLATLVSDPGRAAMTMTVLATAGTASSLVGGEAAAADGAAVGGSEDAAMGTHYMGAEEAAEVEETGTIPNRYPDGSPRTIHYTEDAPTTSASEAQSRYNLPSKPTHYCRFRLCNVQNSESIARGHWQC